MSASPELTSGLPSRGRGVYTLAVVMILLAASTLLVRSLIVTSTQEVRSSTNDRMAHEVFHAAEAALEYGIAWYTDNEPDWPTTAGTQVTVPTAAMDPVSTPAGDAYAVTVTYTRDSDLEAFILVTGTATLASDAQITATVQQVVHSNIILRDRQFVGPPLLINGCFGKVTGTAEIHVVNDPNERVAVSSSHPPPGHPAHNPDCLDQGNLDYCLEADCSGTALPETDAEQFGQIPSDPDDLWLEVFDLPRADIKAIADREVANGVADEDRSVIWITSDSNYHESWGTAEKPVAVVFAPEADCPKLNGNPVFYGIVFVDSPCTDGQGWGGTEIFGTLVINGDLSKFTANTIIHDWGLAGGTAPDLPKADYVARLPGSWRDF
jgi:hypothetical protein